MNVDKEFEEILSNLNQEQREVIGIIVETIRTNHQSMKRFYHNQNIYLALIAEVWKKLSITQKRNLKRNYIELQKVLIEKKLMYQEVIRSLLSYHETNKGNKKQDEPIPSYGIYFILLIFLIIGGIQCSNSSL